MLTYKGIKPHLSYTIEGDNFFMYCTDLYSEYSLCTLYCTNYSSWSAQYRNLPWHSSPKLKTGCRYENHFKPRVSRMGLSSFVNFNIFLMKFYFFQYVYILLFFESLKSKSTQMLKPQKENSGARNLKVYRWTKFSSFLFWGLKIL